MIKKNLLIIGVVVLVAVGIYYNSDVGLNPDNPNNPELEEDKCEKKLEKCLKGGKKIFNGCCGNCYGEAEKACAPKPVPPLPPYYYPISYPEEESYSEAWERYLKESLIYRKCIELYITSHPDYNKCLKKVIEYNKICKEEYSLCLGELEPTE
tara:strand:- start:103 stop:561 length:459 start_codon:yes stop_codon:yes gene_type:complete